MLLEEILYCRGFAIWNDRQCAVPPTYQLRTLPSGHTFAHDRLVDVAMAAADDGNWVLIAGSAIDVDASDRSLAQVCQHLRAALSVGEPAMFDALDVLAGRFVVVYGSAHGTRVLHDACGTRSVFYSAGPRPLVASHLGLIAEAIGADQSQMETARRAGLKLRYGFPGRSSAAEGVFQLTPNCLLDLATGEIQRYFPREPGPRSDDVAAVRDRVITDVRAQLSALADRYSSMKLSMTAGGDSRVTLAAARPFAPSIDMFTYRRSTDSDVVDAMVAADIAQRFGLRHEIIDISPSIGDQPEFQAFNAVLSRNTPNHHIRPAAYLYWKRFAGQSAVHLPSNLAEIGRGRAKRAEIGRPPIREPADLVRVYNKSMLGDELVESAFADFYHAAQFTKIHDYDPFDLLYWEHRMGMWHSLVVTESDPGFDTHVVFNCRRILQTLLSLPLEQRLAKSAYTQVIDKCWPELMEYPINPPVRRADYTGGASSAQPTRRRHLRDVLRKALGRASLAARRALANRKLYRSDELRRSGQSTDR